jgi:hypothetical protein
MFQDICIFTPLPKIAHQMFGSGNYCLDKNDDCGVSVKIALISEGRSENKFVLRLKFVSTEASPSEYRPFPGLKTNLDGHIFVDDREMDTAVTRLLTTQDADLCQRNRKTRPYCRWYDTCLCGGGVSGGRSEKERS